MFDAAKGGDGKEVKMWLCWKCPALCWLGCGTGWKRLVDLGGCCFPLLIYIFVCGRTGECYWSYKSKQPKVFVALVVSCVNCSSICCYYRNAGIFLTLLSLVSMCVACSITSCLFDAT